MGERGKVQTDARQQIREYLSTRRARLTPEQVGLPVFGGNRRVEGLRREEVATLAGISVEYYIRLERGEATGVSDTVLEGISHALKLNEAERAHLFDLVRLRSCGDGRTTGTAVGRQTLRPTIQRILDSMSTTPAVVYNGRLDVLGSNALGRALYEPLFAGSAGSPGSAGSTGSSRSAGPGDKAPANRALVNKARFTYLDPAARTFWRDWTTIAHDSANLLRAEAGRYPCDLRLTGLIGELSTRSEDFRVHWARHDVRLHTSGVKRIHHPVVGDLELPYEATPLGGDPGQTLLMYTAEPGTASEDSLRMLASWAAEGPQERNRSGRHG